MVSDFRFIVQIGTRYANEKTSRWSSRSQTSCNILSREKAIVTQGAKHAGLRADLQEVSENYIAAIGLSLIRHASQ